MVLILAIGDFHIPHRATDIPQPFKKLLVPGKIHMVLCTGNLTMTDTADWLRSLAPIVHIVQGEYDTMRASMPLILTYLLQQQHHHYHQNQNQQGQQQYQPNNNNNTILPPYKTVTIGSIRLGVIHGHHLVPIDDTETLAITARQLDVDILITGSSSMGVDCFEYENRFFVNPGSATGTGGSTCNPYPGSPLSSSHQLPSFVLLDIVDTNVTAYVYQCELGSEDVKIVKLEYTKPTCENNIIINKDGMNITTDTNDDHTRVITPV